MSDDELVVAEPDGTTKRMTLPGCMAFQYFDDVELLAIVLDGTNASLVNHKLFRRDSLYRTAISARPESSIRSCFQWQARSSRCLRSRVAQSGRNHNRYGLSIRIIIDIWNSEDGLLVFARCIWDAVESDTVKKVANQPDEHFLPVGPAQRLQSNIGLAVVHGDKIIVSFRARFGDVQAHMLGARRWARQSRAKGSEGEEQFILQAEEGSARVSRRR